MPKWLEAACVRPDEAFGLANLELWLRFTSPLDGEVAMEKTVLARRLMTARRQLR